LTVLADGGRCDLDLSGHFSSTEPFGEELGGATLAFGEGVEPGGEVEADGGLVGGSEASVGGQKPVLPGSGRIAGEVFEGKDPETGGSSDPGMVKVANASSEGPVGTDGAAILDPAAGEADDASDADLLGVLAALEESVPGDPCGGSGLGEGLVAVLSGPSVASEVIADGGVDARECGLEFALGSRDESGVEADCGGHGGDLTRVGDRPLGDGPWRWTVPFRDDDSRRGLGLASEVESLG
jgi:hypothetical protein